jgi:D-alanyl-D-alanine carboxypeptidase
MAKFAFTVFALASQALLAASKCPSCPSWVDEFGENWVAKTPEIPGIQLTLSSPQLGIECTKSWQNTSPNYTAHPLLSESPSRLASVTKPFTALTVLRLVQDGKIDVNGSVVDYLPDWAISTLVDMQGAENASQITPWMLMHHTSGIDNHNGLEFMSLWLANPNLFMSHRETLEWAAAHLSPAGAPGERFVYTDTGFAYLTALIAHVTGSPFHEVVREAASLDDLGMDNTWWEILEPAPPGSHPRAGQWLADLEITDVNASVALWGGTGMVSNSQDLVKFARAVHTGQLLGEEAMAMLYTTVPTGQVGYDTWNGCGWMSDFVEGQEAWYHRGGFGVWMYYFKEFDLAVTGAMNQGDRLPIMRDMVPEIMRNILADIAV